MSVLTDIADDIVTAINAGTYAIEDIEPFNAESVRIIDPELVKADKLIVKVAPLTVEKSLLNRNATLNVYTFQVAVIKHVNTSDNTDFDMYMDFVEEVGDDTLEFLESTTHPNASWVGLTLPLTYSPTVLRQRSLFWAVIETRYRLGK